MSKLTDSELKRLLSKYQVANSDCWLWTGARDYQGYGMMRLRGSVKRAHLLSFMHFCEEIPVGMKIMHTCDEPSCGNPAHLNLGTQKDNVQDMLLKGRRRQSKLTEDDVIAIREMLSQDYSQADIAREFGVSPSHISRLAQGKHWSFL